MNDLQQAFATTLELRAQGAGALLYALAGAVGGAAGVLAWSWLSRRGARKDAPPPTGDAPLSATFENAAVGMAHTAASGRFLRVNQRLAEMLGYSTAELEGRSVADVTAPEDQSAANEARRRLLAGEIVTATVEKEYLRRNGSRFWGHLTVSVVRRPGEEPYFIAMVEDITERRRAQDELRNVERRFRAFMDRIPGLAYIASADGKYVYGSEPFLRQLGLRQEDLGKAQAQHWLNRPTADEVERMHERVLGSRVEQTLLTVGVEGSDRSYLLINFPLDLGDSTYVGGLAVDITDQQRASAALAAQQEATRASEQRYRAIVETASDGIFIIDERSAILFANPAAERLFVYGPGEMLGKPLTAIMPPDLAGRHNRSIRQYLQTGERTISWRGAELQGMTSSGEIIPLEISFGEYAADGERRFVGIVRDISDRRRTEAALRETEMHLQRLIAKLPLIVWMTDADLRLRSVFGSGAMSRDSTLLTLPALFSAFDAADTAVAAHERALAGESVRLDVTTAGQTCQVTIDPYRDAAGVIVGTAGFIFDITERQQLQERVARAALEWRQTFDAVDSPIVVIDGTGRIRRVNKAAAELGRTDVRDLAGVSIESVQAGDGPLAAITDIARHAARQLEERQSVTERVTVADRTWVVLVAPVENESGSGIIVIATDVTALARMEADLRRGETMSAMGALVAGVAHEVRNPLFGMAATLDAFEATFGTEQFRDYTVALREQVTRMTDLMHELLEYGKPAPAEFRPTAVSPIVEAARSSIGALARSRGVTVTSSVAPELPPVRGDYRRLLQVFENLLRNAIEHSATNTEVTVTAEAGAKRVAICVQDRGTGFRPQDLPRIFEPFFTRRRGGTGLGLSLVRRIIDEHGGTIEASNRDGGGAVVSISLPLAEEEATA